MGADDRRRERARLAATIRDRRESAGLSRRDVADRSGLSYPYVSQLENGDREPSLDALGKLAGAFGVPVDDLLKSSGPTVLAASAPSPNADTDQTGAAWLANPAYASSPTAAALPRSRARRVDLDLVVEDAYAALLSLGPQDRLDAAGSLLARCLRDSVG